MYRDLCFVRIIRLSERNCIEIVQKLTAGKLVDVIYTTDGKEYLTPQELRKEIVEELQVQGGTVNIKALKCIEPYINFLR